MGEISTPPLVSLKAILNLLTLHIRVKGRSKNGTRWQILTLNKLRKDFQNDDLLGMPTDRVATMLTHSETV